MKNLFILCSLVFFVSEIQSQDSYVSSTEIFADLGAPADFSYTDVEPLSMSELMGAYPVFPGGEPGMIKYIQQHLVYPELARSHAHEGTVVIEFVIETDGSIGEVEVVKGMGLGCNEAARAVFEKMPSWKPAYQGGRAVAVKYVTPVKFRLR